MTNERRQSITVTDRRRFLQAITVAGLGLSPAVAPSPGDGRPETDANAWCSRRRRREANLLERGDRFGPAADQREPLQRLHHLVLRPARRARGDQHPRADTGQQNQRVPVAGEECLAERERFALVGQRNLAHGRRLDRLAGVVADQFSHLRRPAALEADYPQPVQRVRHGTCLESRPHTSISMSAPVTRTG
jgi:hypothetical protein